MCGVEEVVFYGIARAVHLHVAEARHLAQGIQLHLYGQGGRETVQVILLSVHTLGFEEKLVLVLVGKGNQLCLYAGAVSGTYALYLSVVQRRLGKALSQALVNVGVCVRYPARQLG